MSGTAQATVYVGEISRFTCLIFFTKCTLHCTLFIVLYTCIFLLVGIIVQVLYVVFTMSISMFTLPDFVSVLEMRHLYTED